MRFYSLCFGWSTLYDCRVQCRTHICTKLALPMHCEADETDVCQTDTRLMFTVRQTCGNHRSRCINAEHHFEQIRFLTRTVCTNCLAVTSRLCTNFSGKREQYDLPEFRLRRTQEIAFYVPRGFSMQNSYDVSECARWHTTASWPEFA